MRVRVLSMVVAVLRMCMRVLRVRMGRHLGRGKRYSLRSPSLFYRVELSLSCVLSYKDSSGSESRPSTEA